MFRLISQVLVCVLAFNGLPVSGGRILPRACTKSVTAKQGDSCATISRAAGITVTDFINYNPSVTSCSALAPGTTYCIASADTPPPAEPTQPGKQVSTNGQCGNDVTCAGSIYGDCCSEHGWCGSSDEHCGAGCQAGFGTCAGSGPGPGTTSAPPPISSPPPTSVSQGVTTLPPRPTSATRVTTTVTETRTTYIVSTTTTTSTAVTTSTKTSTTTSTSVAVRTSTTTSTSVTVRTSTVSEIKTFTSTSTVTQTFRLTSIETSVIFQTDRSCPTGKPPAPTTIIFPSPTSEGITRNCKEFYRVKKGDDCDKIIAAYGTFDLIDFYKWNPTTDCSDMLTGYYICVGV